MNRLNALRIGGVVWCVAILIATARIGSAQTDPHLGTWALSLQQSKFASGTAPQSQTSVYSADGQGIKVATTTVNGAGVKINTEFTATPDGKDYPVRGNPDWDTTALKRIDGRTLEFIRKKGGKVVQNARSVVSADGKSRTVTVTGVNAQGQKINTASVWIRK
jgi:hypothetical protein